MCLGVPAKVISIDGSNAVAEMGGVTYPVSLALTEDVTEGDFVLVHAGFVIEKIDPAEAAETLRLIREIGETWSGEGAGDEAS
jgi:hydrogenase expression/formation protein HypC